MSSLLDLGPQVVARYSSSRGLAYQPCTADSFNSVAHLLLSHCCHRLYMQAACATRSAPAFLFRLRSAVPTAHTLPRARSAPARFGAALCSARWPGQCLIHTVPCFPARTSTPSRCPEALLSPHYFIPSDLIVPVLCALSAGLSRAAP